jgi:hypothetical protein
VAASPRDSSAEGPFNGWRRQADGQQGRGDPWCYFGREEEHGSGKGKRGHSGGFNAEA